MVLSEGTEGRQCAVCLTNNPQGEGGGKGEENDVQIVLLSTL